MEGKKAYRVHTVLTIETSVLVEATGKRDALTMVREDCDFDKLTEGVYTGGLATVAKVRALSAEED